MLAREGAAWRLPLVVSALLWLALNLAISSGALIVLLETSFLLALLQPLLKSHSQADASPTLATT